MLLILMSFMTATAAVETNLPYNGTRNLPPDDSYAFFDFEEGTGHFDSLLPSQYADIKFTNIFANNRDHIWSYNDAQFPLMHVYPQNVFFQDDKVIAKRWACPEHGMQGQSPCVPDPDEGSPAQTP